MTTNQFARLKTLFYDIETGPLNEDELQGIIPRFNASEVKTGNLKDPEKIAAKLAQAKASYWRDALKQAALNALTGRVVAIGVRFENGDHSVLGEDDEARTLRAFWTLCQAPGGGLNRMIGFNTHLFDLPFLIRRSFKYRIEVPPGIRRGRYWAEEMVDLREVWQMGDRQAHGSLNSIAQHLGVGSKTGHGEDFAQLWRADRDKALAYLQTDLELTARIAEALDVVGPVVKPIETSNCISGEVLAGL